MSVLSEAWCDLCCARVFSVGLVTGDEHSACDSRLEVVRAWSLDHSNWTLPLPCAEPPEQDT